jgi:hypothetical protein
MFNIHVLSRIRGVLTSALLLIANERQQCHAILMKIE